MIITIFTGGSGSEYIQTALYKIIPHLEINLIINGYDDGKSTGILRKLFPGTLGISDFRKNQILEYKLIYGKTQTYTLLNSRFTVKDGAYKFVIDLINNSNIEDKLRSFLLDNTNYFFNTKQSKEIIYEDFSFMNIVYCSLLDKFHGDMEHVCKIIKNELSLKNNIFLNSNEILTLNGITKKGKILLDEASIVDFNDNDDKIIDVFFNEKKLPILNKNTQEVLLNSDIILFSCGTQFSSLVPTYKTLLFKETIRECKGYKYLVLNADFDKDIINYNGDELLNKINKDLPLDDVKIIISDNMNTALFPASSNFTYINIPRLIVNKNKHNGFVLWKYIFYDYFKRYYNKNYIFDYDYTIFDKDFLDISNENINLLEKMKNSIVVTNNCISNLMPINNVIIYSNIGNIVSFKNDINIVDSNFVLHDSDIDNIKQIVSYIDPKNKYNITNRKNTSISLKPIENRDKFIRMFDHYLSSTNYQIIKTGKTTIEFIKKGLSKRKLFIDKHFLTDDYTYITDINDIEYESQLDKNKMLLVKNIFMSNLFLKSILINQKYDFCIIVGGINNRMQIDYPKCLIEVDNEVVLLKMLTKIKPYANNIFICGSNYYKEHFSEFEKTLKNFENVYFLYFDSIDGKQYYPKGNGETVYQLLKSVILTNKIFIMWGDVLLSNNKIFEEMYNLQYDNDFLIPTIYEENPYAYLVLDDTNKVKKIGYKQSNPVPYGFHDQCIFLCTTELIKDHLEEYIKNLDKSYNELNFLDIVQYVKNVSYYNTTYSVRSFNIMKELYV